jgi:AcrR family transcriptional regulator
MRADARRNRERILAAAGTAIARDGAEASLEEIARLADVGSATLHRHFASRRALLEAVFTDRVDTLCARARELLSEPDPGAALVRWLHAVGAHAATNRGLGAALMPATGDGGPTPGESAHVRITAAGEALLDRARRAGAVRPAATIDRLLTLIGAIALATEHGPDDAEEADRLLDLALEGVRPRQ